MSSKLYFWLAVLLLPAMVGCYPKGAQYYSDFDLVYTNHSDSIDFTKLKTYARPDSIIKITGDVFNGTGTGGGGENEPTFLPQAYADVIFNQVDKNMAAYGWTKVDKNADPDAILLMSVSNTSYMYWYYDWGYWGWWYPGYYPGWGWGYPGYYPPYVSTYTTGTLLVQMVDQQEVVTPPGTANVPVVWVCVLNGLVNGSATDVGTRVQNGLDQAFVQSPYLKH